MVYCENCGKEDLDYWVSDSIGSCFCDDVCYTQFYNEVLERGIEMDYLFTDKNSSCVLTLSAKDDKEAKELLEEKVKNAEYWRMEKIEY